MMVSTARVLAIGPDAYGIPHVRFEITLASQSGHSIGHESRVLSLESFAELYSEPVGEPVAV